MKAVVHARIAGQGLRDAVPPAYRDAIAKAVDPNGVYTLIMCAHTERDVIPSAHLAKALKKVAQPAPDGIVVIGTVFTEEAKGLAAEHGARIVSLHGAKWTDASARLRQLPPDTIGTWR